MTFNPAWQHPEERNDPTARARRIARVLLGLLPPDDALAMANSAAERGEDWLLDGFRRDLGLADVTPIRKATP